MASGTRGTRKTTPARATLSYNTRATVDGRTGYIDVIRRRKFAKRYGIRFEDGSLEYHRLDEFYQG